MEETPFQGLPMEKVYTRKPGESVRWVIQVKKEADVSAAMTVRRPAWGPNQASVREQAPRINAGCSHVDLFLDVVRDDGLAFIQKSAGATGSETASGRVVAQPLGAVQTTGAGLIVVDFDSMSLPPAAWAEASKVRLVAVMDMQVLVVSTPFAIREAEPVAAAPIQVERSSFAAQLHHALTGIHALRCRMRVLGASFALKFPGSEGVPAMGALCGDPAAPASHSAADAAGSAAAESVDDAGRPDYAAILPDVMPAGMVPDSDVVLGMLTWSEAVFKLQKAQLEAEASTLGALFNAPSKRGPAFSPQAVMAGLGDRSESLVATEEKVPAVHSGDRATEAPVPAASASAATATAHPAAGPLGPASPADGAPGFQSPSGWEVLLQTAPGGGAIGQQASATSTAKIVVPGVSTATAPAAPATATTATSAPAPGGLALQPPPALTIKAEVADPPPDPSSDLPAMPPPAPPEAELNPPPALAMAPPAPLVPVADAHARDSPFTADHSSFRDNASHSEDSDFDADAEPDAPSSPDSVGFWESMSSRRYVETIVHVLILALGFEQFESGDLARDLCTVFSHIKPTAQARTGARLVGPHIVWPKVPPSPPAPAVATPASDSAPEALSLGQSVGDAPPSGAVDITGPPQLSSVPLPSLIPPSAAPAAAASSSSSSAALPPAHAAAAPPSVSGTASSSSSPPRPIRIRIRAATKHRLESDTARRLRTRLMSGLVDLSDSSVMTHKSGAAKRRRSALRALMASVVAAALGAKIVDSSIFLIPTVRRMAGRAKKRQAGPPSRGAAPEPASKRRQRRPGSPAQHEAFRSPEESPPFVPSAARRAEEFQAPFTARPMVPIATISGLQSSNSGQFYRGRMPHTTEQALSTTLSGRAWGAGGGGGADAVPHAPVSHPGGSLTQIPSADFRHAGTTWPGDGSLASGSSLTGATGFLSAAGFSSASSLPSGAGSAPRLDPFPRSRHAAMTIAQQRELLWAGELGSSGSGGGFPDLGPRPHLGLSAPPNQPSGVDVDGQAFQQMRSGPYSSSMSSHRMGVESSSLAMDGVNSRFGPGSIPLQVRSYTMPQGPAVSQGFATTREALRGRASHFPGAPSGPWASDQQLAAAHAAMMREIQLHRLAALQASTSRAPAAGMHRRAPATYEEWEAIQRAAHPGPRGPRRPLVPPQPTMAPWAAAEYAGFAQHGRGMQGNPYGGQGVRGPHPYMDEMPPALHGRFPGDRAP